MCTITLRSSSFSAKSTISKGNKSALFYNKKNSPSVYFQLPLIVPNAPIKINFEVTAVVDPDDGLQPSDLTPETASVRVMILKSTQVNIFAPFISLNKFQYLVITIYNVCFRLSQFWLQQFRCQPRRYFNKIFIKSHFVYLIRCMKFK